MIRRDRRRTLKRVLFRSHIVIAGSAVGMLLAALVALRMQRESARHLAEGSAATAQRAEALMGEVHRSTSALRGWMLLQDPAQRTERAAAWTAIDDHLDDLGRRLPAGLVQELTRTLRDLQEIQWVIEDQAHSPGRWAVRHALTEEVGPVADNAFRLLEAILGLEEDAPLTPAHRRMLLELAGMRGALTEIVRALDRFGRAPDAGGGARLAPLFARLDAHVAGLKSVAGKPTTDQAQLVVSLAREIGALEGLADGVLRLGAGGGDDRVERLMQQQALPLTRAASKMLDDLADDAVRSMREDTRRVEKMGDLGLVVLLAFFALTGVFAVGLSVTGARRLAGPVQSLARASAALSRGQLEGDLPPADVEELAQLIRAFNRMRHDLREREEALQASEKHLVAQNQELSSQHAVERVLGQLGHRMQGELSVEELAGRALDSLLRATGAPAGALFARLGDDPVAERLAAAGWVPQPGEHTVAKPGEGVSGRALATGAVVDAAGLPAGFLRVDGGVGQAATTQVTAFPIRLGGDVIGVLELGGFTPLGDDARDLVRRAEESVALALVAAIRRWRLREALDVTQRQATSLRAQAEELQQQGEELRQTNEELAHQADALRASEQRLQQQQEELRAANEELEQQAQALEASRSALEEQNAELQTARGLLERRAEELEQASTYKSEFLANMSHELRTPLNSLLILSKLLVENRAGTLTDEQLEWARTIHSSGTDLLGLINDILDLSKVEAGKLDVHIDAVRLSDISARVQETLGPSAAARHLALSVEVAEDAPIALQTDGARLEQILLNLLSNALKFTPEGRVTLRMGRPDASLALTRPELVSGPAVAFEVSDTGIGISEDHQALIFEAFRQADGSTSRRYGGTGLGLSITREMTARLGGEVYLRSTQGGGSTFTVVLPEAGPPASEDGPAPQGGAPVAVEPADQGGFPERFDGGPTPGPPALLVVEDDDVLRKTLVALAEARGFRVVGVRTGEEALEVAAARPLVGILLDIGLPGVDGWAVLDRLRESPRTAGIPVHILSGRADVATAQARGATVGLVKPVSPEALMRELEGLLSPGATRRVLLLDDRPTDQQAVSLALQQLGVEVDVATTVAAADQALGGSTYDCVVMDIALHDGSSLPLLRRLGAAKRPPVILHTARSLSEEEEADLRRYARAIVMKAGASSDRLVDEVRLFLRAVSERMPTPVPPPPATGRPGVDVLAGRTILLCDDDIRNVFALSRLLEQNGVDVLVARNGAEALRVLDAHVGTVDLILMDIMMPEMDGYEAMGRIRADPRFGDLPIVAVTAKAMRGDAERCVASGASDYLSKPVDSQRLLALLRVWLGR